MNVSEEGRESGPCPSRKRRRETVKAQKLREPRWNEAKNKTKIEAGGK